MSWPSMSRITSDLETILAVDRSPSYELKVARFASILARTSGACAARCRASSNSSVASLIRPSSAASRARACAVGPQVAEKDQIMPMFIDVHTIEGGVSVTDVAAAHQADLAIQGSHDVNYVRYWVDEEAGKIFCLVEAPDAEAAHRVHSEAHGLVAGEIYQVSEHT